MNSCTHVNNSQVEDLVDIDWEVCPHQEEPEGRSDVGHDQGVKGHAGQDGLPWDGRVLLALVPPGHGLEGVLHQVLLLGLRNTGVALGGAGREEVEDRAPQKPRRSWGKKEDVKKSLFDYIARTSIKQS